MSFVVSKSMLRSLGVPLFRCGTRSLMGGLAVMTASLAAQIAQVQHAPSVNGTIDGSVQQMSAEGVTLNGGANITGDLSVPGTPVIQLNGSPTYGGTLEGSGSASPSNFTIMLNSGASLRHVIRRTNAVSLPTVATVPTPSGTASVTISTAGQSVTWTNLKNLTLNSNVGVYTVPAGTYGNFSASSGTGFKLGVAGATQASVYNFQNFTLNGNSTLQVLGPVVINLANGFSANAPIGASSNPAWLTLNIKSGGFTLNSGCNLYGYVVAPSGTVIINAGTQLVGGVSAAYLTVNGNGLLKLQAQQTTNQLPVISLTAPTNGAVYTAPGSFSLTANASDPDGTVSTVEFFQGSTKIGQSTTAPYSFNVTGLTAGNYTYFARATDNSGATADSSTISVTVNSPNQPPVVSLTSPANGATFTAPAAVTLVASASDSDGSIAHVDFYQGSVFIGQATSAPYQLTTSTLSAGSYVFSAKAYDNASAITTSANVTITVVNPNQPPTVSITAPANGTSYDDPASFSITATASDPDGSISKVELFQNGVRLTEDLTAPYAFSVSGLPVGTYDFVARATDNQNSSVDSAAVRITVAHINDAPVANAQSRSVAEDTPLTVTLTGSDPDGDTLSYAIVTQPAHGTLAPGSSSNIFIYTPAQDFNGNDSFTFKVSDGALQSAPATVQITVTPVNDPPVSYPASYTLNEGASVPFVLGATDVDSPSLTFSVVSGVNHGSLSGALPNLTYTPAAGYSGSDSLTYTVSDGQFTSAPATVSFTINHVNRAPVVALTAPASGSSYISPASFTLKANASDSDGTVTKVEFFQNGTKIGEATSAPYDFAVSSLAVGSYSYTARATDNSSATTDSLAISVAVVANIPPNVTLTAPADGSSAIAPAAITLTANASDSDGSIARVEFYQGSTLLGQSTTAPYSFTTSALASGSYTFSAKAYDNLGASAVSTVATVTVVNPNQPPTVALTAPANNAQFIAPASITLIATASDSDGSVTKVEFFNGSTKIGEALTSPYQFNWSGVSAGNYSLTARATDNVGATKDSAAVVVSVIANTPPVVSLTAPANGAVFTPPASIVLTASASDSDGSISKVEFFAGASKIGETSTAPYQFSWSNVTSGDYTLTARATDNLGALTTSASLSITVNALPVANSQTVSTSENVSLPITLTGSDLETPSASLVYTVVAQPAHGTFTGTAPHLTYVPNSNYTGGDSFTFKVNDGRFDSAIATVTITVQAVNHPPVATGPASITTAEDTPVSVILTGTDPEGSVLNYTVTVLPQHGTLSGTAPNLTYTPTLNYNGSDSLTFKVNDGSLDSSLATVAITVTPVNDIPVADPASVTVTTGVPKAITLTGSDVETPAASLVFTVITNPTHGTLSGIAPNLTYTSAPDFGGFDSFTFTVNDGTATSAPATVQLTTGLAPRSRTYTTTGDFTSGTLTSLITSDPDQLSNKTILSSFNAVWIANSSKGTIVKIDPDTARVIGEYNAKPVDSTSPYPSRIAVDSKGDVWVANMSHNTIVKIGLPENGHWVDRNGNGQIDTSGSLGDIRDWDEDDISAAQDEAILLYVHTAVNGVRHLSVDKDDNVWVGGSGGPWQKFDGHTGQLMRTEPSLGIGGSGGFISLNGLLYSAGTDFLVWNTNNPIEAQPMSTAVRQGAWASAIDSKGNLWVTKDWTSTVIKYAPDGTMLGEFYHGEPWAMGIAIDANDDVWVAHSHCGHSVGHLNSDGLLLGNVEVANHGPVEVSIDRRGRIWVASSTGVVDRINPVDGPLGADGVTRVGKVDLTTGNLGGALWTYGRFSGNSNALASPDGLWTFVYDGVLSGSTWGSVVWNALLSNDGNIVVEGALSSDGVTYGAYQPLTFGHSTPTGAGRFLKIRTRLISSTTGESPVLYDLSVGTEGYVPPDVPSAWSVFAGDDIVGNWPDKIQLKGVFRHTVQDFSTEPTYSWSKVSGPDDVTFYDANMLRPKVEFKAKGDYVLRLTATLNSVVSASDIKVSLVPYNRPPYVNAGYTSFHAEMPSQVWLWGSVSDDNLPQPVNLTSHWSKLFGPGDVTFADSSLAATSATFSSPGVYVLQLSATDGELTATDVTTVWLGYSCMPAAPAGLVSWWQASGNGDDHVGGNQAFTEKGTDYAEGKLGGAFHFDGINDRVRVFGSPSLDVGTQDGMTVELWANPSEERVATLFEYGDNTTNGVQIRQVNRTIEVYFREVNGTSHLLSSGEALPAGVWTHVTASYNHTTGEARVFINGLLRNVQNIGLVVLGTNRDIFMGGLPGTTESFKGLLDEISVYNRAIYADEITTIVAHDKRPPVSNLPPVVSAGSELYRQPVNAPVNLTGSAVDDGQPIDGILSSRWSVVTGPGSVVFADATQLHTTATFSQPGSYALKLHADDGAFCADSTVQVHVDSLYRSETDSSLVAWWPANGDDLDVVHGIKLERFHGMTFGIGQVMQDFAFDGINNFAYAQSTADMDIGASPAGLSVEFWVKSDRVGQADTPLVWWDSLVNGTGSYVYANGAGRTAFLHLYDAVGNGYDLAGNSILEGEAGNWVHLAFTYDRVSGVARVYKNGALKKETIMPVGLIARTGPGYRMWVGSAPNNYSNFKGGIDELSLYNRPLSFTEVQATYNAGTIGKAPLNGNHAPVISLPAVHFAQKDVSGLTVLNALVVDDGAYPGTAISVHWTQISGPGVATFGDANVATTSVSFSLPGIYVLRLDANDGVNVASSETVEVRVGLLGVKPVSGLAAWWPANGDPHEAINGNHDMELYSDSGVGYGPGKVSQAFVLDGSTSFARVPGSADMDIGASPAGLSVEFWVKSDRVAQADTPFVWWDSLSNGTGSYVYANGAGRTAFLHLYDAVGNGYDLSGDSVLEGEAGNWVHLAFTYDKVSGLGRVYKNGTMKKEIIMPVGLTARTASDYRMWVGSAPNNYTNFKGAIDELSLYKRPLNFDEVQAIYLAGSAGKTPPDDNQAPVVSAGPNVILHDSAQDAILVGSVTDDNKPLNAPPTIAWTVEDGPGTVTFGDASVASTTAHFSAPGTYVLRLTASDGLVQATDLAEVRVGLLGVKPASGLAAWWPANGDPHEAINGNHDMELYSDSNIGYGPGKVSEAFIFDGATSFARVPGSADMDIGASPAGLSVEFWVKSDRVAQADTPFVWWQSLSNGTGSYVYANGAGRTAFLHLYDAVGNGYDLSGDSVLEGEAGKWVHLAFTYDKVSGLGRVYKNGTMKKEILMPAGLTARTAPDYRMWVGSAPNNYTSFKGAIDELSLYKRPLAFDEVQAIYLAGSAGKTPPDDNQAPVVSAGPNVILHDSAQDAILAGSVTDDNKPLNAPPTIAWTVEDGPGTVTFGNAGAANTTAHFSVPGIYVLRLTASDGLVQATDLTEVRVGLLGVKPVSGLAAWWPANGDPHEVINGNHDMELYSDSNIGYGPGKVSEAFVFDGSTSFARVSGSADMDIGASPDGVSVEFWVKSDRVGQNDTPFVWWHSLSNGTGSYVYANGAGRTAYLHLYDAVGNGYDLAGNSVLEGEAGNWVHLAFTYDKVSGLGRVYKNGTMKREMLLPAGLTARTAADYRMWVGSAPNNYTNFKGAIDELSLYKRPLSFAEVQAIYLAGSAGKTPPDDNQAPVVSAGPNVAVADITQNATLSGSVTDDNKPLNAPPSIAWTVENGPGTVTFGNAGAANTTAHFSVPGIYILRLTASDGLVQATDLTEVRAGIVGVNPVSGLSAWWPANGDPHEAVNGNHDMELYSDSGVGYGPGRVSEAFIFDGATSFARVTGSVDTDIGASADGLTVEFWVKSDRVGQTDTPLVWWDSLSNGTGSFVYANGAGRTAYLHLYDAVGNGYDLAGASVLDGEAGNWVHLAFTYDKVSGVGRVYKNGTKVKDTILPTGLIARTAPDYRLWVGSSPNNFTNFKGGIDELSLYKRPLTESEIGEIYAADIAGKDPFATNAIPTISLVAPLSGSSFVADTPISLSAVAIDTDGTVAKVEFFDGSTKIGETTTAQPGQPQVYNLTLNAGLALGLHPITAVVTDNIGAKSTSGEAMIKIVPVLPFVNFTFPTDNSTLTAGVPVTLAVTATYSAGTIAKIEFYDGAIKLGETLAPSDGSSYQLSLPAGFSGGSHTLTARATGSDAAVTTSAPIHITTNVVLPVVTLTSPVNGTTIVTGAPLSLTASATTAQGSITKVEFFDGATKLGERTVPNVTGGSVYTFTVNAGLTVGSHSLSAKATTSTATTAVSMTVTVTAGTYTGEPTATIAQPLDGTRISAPVTVSGIVAMQSLTSWKLEYRLKAAEGAPVEPWTTLVGGTGLVGSPASGSSAAIPGVLGTFDPTRLINGIYELDLRATDASASTVFEDPITVVVEGNMKVGAFTLAFEDLKVPVAGVPISVTRTYDSRDTRVGDFGPGWRIAVNNIRVQKNHTLGAGWYQTEAPVVIPPFFPFYVDPLSDRVVTVTMPDGETHRFRGGVLVRNYGSTPDNVSTQVPATQGSFKFYALGDTTSTLEPLDDANQLSDQFWIDGTGEQDLYQGISGDLGSDGFPVIYNPSRFRLTTKDGTKFIVDERLGLLKLEDLTGNTLVLNRDGQDRVTSLVSTQVTSSGNIVTSVAIHRDATGRVDYIRDPAGKDLDYTYDASGRLATFVNRELNTTQFKYENASFPYYLTKIIDPRGVAALRSEFDTDGKLIKQIDADGKENVFEHGINVTGRFEKITDRLGHATTLFYDDRGNVTTKIDPLGAQTTYSYYPDSDWVKFETNHYGTVTSKAYDKHGNVTVETMGASTSEDPANPSTGFITKTTYDDFSSPTQMIDPDGRIQKSVYDPVTNEVLSTTDGFGGPAPSTTTYHYNSDGTIDTVTDALGNVTSNTYEYAFSSTGYPDAVKQVTTTVTDPAGAPGSDFSNASDTILRISRVIYDAQENVLAQIITRTLPGGGTEEVVTRYLYDSENRLKATLMPDGKVSETRYTSFGKTAKTLLWSSLADYLSGDDTHARVTSYGYDDRGNETSVSQADGSYELKSYDPESRVEWQEDANRNRTWFTYDFVGRKTHTYQPDATPLVANDGPGNETIYDLVGRVRYEMDEVGSLIEYTYDNDCGCAMRRKSMVRHLQAGNEYTFFEYDKTGNQISTTDPRGKTIVTDYDDHSRPVAVHFPATDELPANTTHATYDLLGRRVALTDQEGKITRYRYDGIGRLFEVRQYLDQSIAAGDANFSASFSAPGVISTRYSFDELGNQISQTDARGNTTNFNYDSVGRRTKRILPDGAAETMQYDVWGNLWKRTDFKGYSTTYLYDTLNRLTEKDADLTHPSLIYSHAPDKIIYGYDAAGNRTDATVKKGSTVLYVEDTPVDERGRRQFKNTPYGKLTYGYYANSLLRSITSSNADGVHLGYRYDDANRLAYVDDTSGPNSQLRTTNYTYNANGSLETVTAANGVVHTYTYDSLNRLRTLNVAKTGTTLHSYEYKLRASGHRQQVIENGARATTFAYDDLYRLTAESIAGDTHGNSGVIGYTLDKVGNRLSRSSQLSNLSSQPSLTYNSRDWLSGDTYDANGNTLTSPFTAYSSPLTVPDVYDFEDHLIIRHKPDGSTVNLAYDADGLLRQKTILNAASLLVSATGYLIDGSNPTGYAQILEERINTTSGTTVKTYAYGSDLISRTMFAGNGSPITAYFLYDGLGSVRELSDESGVVTEVYDYDAFGDLIFRTGSTDNDYLYRGERYESDIGEYYLRARFFNQNTGRFWSMDRYEGLSDDPVSLHRYLAVNADPINNIDPSGQYTLFEVELTEAINETIESVKNIGVQKAEKKSVKTISCVVGVAFAERGLDAEFSDSLEGHHPIGQSFGGAAAQDLVYLPVNTHRAFHAILNGLIKGSTEFKNFTGYTSADDWALALAKPLKKRALLTLIKAAAKYIDKKCGLPAEVSLTKYINDNQKRWLSGK